MNAKVWEDFVDSFSASLVNGGFPQTKDNNEKQSSSYFPAAKRVIAIGDIHGDFNKALQAFHMVWLPKLKYSNPSTYVPYQAGLIDSKQNWVGGKTVVVQVGDILDRGGQELETFYFLERMKKQAEQNGGKLHVLNGNHEIMNVAGRFRYATEEGMNEFQRWEKISHWAQRLKCKCKSDVSKCEAQIPTVSEDAHTARRTALQPGGYVAKRFLSNNPVSIVVGSTAFAHGGLHPKHVDYGISRINRETMNWISKGDRSADVPWFLSGRNAVVWSRQYSHPDENKCNCEMLQTALRSLSQAERMVVGHTVQYPMGINAACDDSVFRIDVGMSNGVCDAHPEVLEIIEDREVRRLRPLQSAQVLVSASKANKKIVNTN